MFKAIFHSGWRWLWISAIVLIIDRVTKVLIQQHFMLYDVYSVLPFFNLTLAYNKGAAFSFLSSAAGWQAWLFGVLAVSISIALLVWLKRISYRQWWVAVALTFIIGGALGNLWDRLSYGHVIDFIDLHIANWHWPVFNVADSAICIGAVMLVMSSYSASRE